MAINPTYKPTLTPCPWQAVVEDDDATLGQLLRGLEQQDQKKCDTDAGGCDAPSSVQHFLLLRGQRPPDVFTLQLAWESTREDPEDIRDTLDAITEARHVPLHPTHLLRVQGFVGFRCSWPVRARARTSRTSATCWTPSPRRAASHRIRSASACSGYRT